MSPSILERACALVVAYGPVSDSLALVHRLREHMSVVVCDNEGDFPPLEAVDVVRPGGNIGFGAAVNRAMGRCSAEFVVLANPDTDLDIASVERLLDVMRARPELGVLGPRLAYPDGRPQINGGRYSGLVAEMARLTGLGRLVRGMRAALRPDRRVGEPRVVPRQWITGAVMVVRSHAFQAVGGFDERFQLYFEDEDLCRRMAHLGFYAGVFTGVTVVHGVGGSRAVREPYRSREYQNSRVLYHRKHSPAVVESIARLSARRTLRSR